MTATLDRRRMLLTGAAAGAALVLPARRALAATVSTASPYEQRILAVAARERARVGSHLWRGDIVGIADFALPSWKPRMHLANLESGTVRSFLLSHGKGSDPQHDGWLKTFSDVPGSEATPRGAMVTRDWYVGKYGTSLRLDGLDLDNASALERMIVMHQAWYAEPDMIARWGKLGRSFGCFALGREAYREVLFSLYGGRLLFADRIGEA